MEIVMQMRYMNGFLRELSENILNHIKILSDWRTKTIRDYVELSFISNSHFENFLSHQRLETAKKDKIAIVFLKKHVIFVLYIKLIICIIC